MKTKIIFILLAVALCGTACKKNNVYSDLLKAERKLIESYIQTHNIHVVDSIEMPTVWEDNMYWKVPDYDNFYFHLVALGDTTQAELEKNEVVCLRFIRYGLEPYTDTLYNWTTLDSPNPIKFTYDPLRVTSEQTCLGWQLALKHMKYKGSQCKIICPSKLGFSEENSSVTPYAYDLKITNIIRY